MLNLRRAVAAGGLAIALGIGLASTGPARASCNTIPPGSQVFRGAVGSVDRPFARAGGSPGDFVEVGGVCESPALKDTNGDGSINERDFVVSVVFKPTGGPQNLVALTVAADCTGLSCAKGGPSPPVHCVAGEASGIAVSAGKLRFRFPDTDAFFQGAGDGRTFTGSAAIVVTSSGSSLPCQLATQRCAKPDGRPEVFACVDELFTSAAGACGTGRSDLDPTFGHFTSLPPVNSYERICHASFGVLPACLDTASEFRFTVDRAGNLALPMRFTNVLRELPGKSRKDNRQLRGGSGIAATASDPAPIQIPSEAFLATFTPVGTRFYEQPLFKPDPLPGRPKELTLFGEADKPESVLWLSRRRLWRHQCATGPKQGEACEPETASQDCGGAYACSEATTSSYYACVGGARAGLPCTRSSHCHQGGGRCKAGSKCFERTGQATPTACTTDLQCQADEECGQGLFEFRGRQQAGAGPIVIYKAAGAGRVCRGGPDDGKACTFACGAFPCVGFRAEAINYRTKP